jgi:hypothetical protein
VNILEDQILVRRDTLAGFVAHGVVPANGEPVALIGPDGKTSALLMGNGIDTVDKLPALSKGDKGDTGNPSDYLRTIDSAGVWIAADGDEDHAVQLVDGDDLIVGDRLPGGQGDLELLDNVGSEWDVALGYRDPNGKPRVFVGRRLDGTWYPAALNGDSRTPIVRWGDSLTENGTGSDVALSAALGRRVYTNGIGGQTSPQIAARQGGQPTRIVNAVTIPASGTVNVTLSVRLRSDAQNPTTVSIAGVLGTFIAASGPDYLTGTFTRSSAGLPAVVPASTPVQTGFAFRDMWPILWFGRNNYSQPNAATQIVSDLRAALAWTKRRDRALIIGIPPWVGEENGTSGRATLDAVNAAIRDAFPAEFIDIAARVRNADVLTAVGVTPTQQDLTDIGNGITPSSFRTTNGVVDGGHFNGVAYQAINKLLTETYTARGWN